MAERLGLSGEIDGADPYYTAPDGTRYLVNNVSVQVDPNQFKDANNRFVDKAVWDRIRNDPGLMITTPDGRQAFREDLMNELAKYYPSSGVNSDNHIDALKGLGMIGGMAGLGALMGGAGGFLTGGEYLGGMGGEILGGAGEFTGVLGGEAVTGGLDVINAGGLDGAIGDTVGNYTAGMGEGNILSGTGSGVGVDTAVNTGVDTGVNSGGLDGPIGDSVTNYTNGMGTYNPLTTAGVTGTTVPPGTSSVLKKILDGTATVDDWAKLLTSAGGSILDYFGDQASGDAAQDLWNQIQNSPGMTRFNDSFKPGWNIMDADPSFQGALDASANAFTRAASAKVGNVGGNPGAWNEIQTNVMNSTLAPWTTNYRAQNLNAAGIAANSVQPFAPSIINSAGSGWDNAGAFLGSMYKPQSGFSIGTDGKITWNSGTSL